MCWCLVEIPFCQIASRSSGTKQMLLRALPGLLRATQAPQALSAALLHTSSATEQPVAKAAESAAKPALVGKTAASAMLGACMGLLQRCMRFACSSRSFKYTAGAQTPRRNQSMCHTRLISTGAHDSSRATCCWRENEAGSGWQLQQGYHSSPCMVCSWCQAVSGDSSSDQWTSDSGHMGSGDGNQE